MSEGTPINPADIRVGDTVKCRTEDRGVVTERTFTVAQIHRDSFGIPQLWTTERRVSRGYQHWRWFLLDRPVARPPVLDAPMGSLWVNQQNGTVWVRTDQQPGGDRPVLLALNRFATVAALTAVRGPVDAAVWNKFTPYIPGSES